MFRMLPILLLLLAPAQVASAQDAFGLVRCGIDIPTVLKAKSMPRGRIVLIEARHRDIGLRDEGAFQVSDSLWYHAWTMCGREIALLVDTHGVIRDALAFPPHSRQRPGFIGNCVVAGHWTRATVLAVLDNPQALDPPRHYAGSDTTLLPTSAAWRVDEGRMQFTIIAAQRIGCPRNYMFTVDGGP